MGTYQFLLNLQHVDKILSNFSFGQEHVVSYIALAKRDSMISFFILEGIDLAWMTTTKRYWMRKDAGPKII
jgi:peptidase E